MQPSDFVFNTTYKQCKAAGVSERISHDEAVTAVSEYRKGRFKTASKLIEQDVASAKSRQRLTK